jgi:hypothetical protein
VAVVGALSASWLRAAEGAFCQADAGALQQLMTVGTQLLSGAVMGATVDAKHEFEGAFFPVNMT